MVLCHSNLNRQRHGLLFCLYTGDIDFVISIRQLGRHVEKQFPDAVEIGVINVR